MQTQIHAGIDILGRPLTPMELTQLKEQRATELRAVQEQQKHASIFSGISRVSGYISLIFRECRIEVELFLLVSRMQHIGSHLNQYTELHPQF